MIKTCSHLIFLTIASIACAHAEQPPSPAQAIELARQTLARQNDFPAKNLEVESANVVQWPDTSLGCPQPGMMYAQVITPGYQVTFMNTASGKTYFVHTGAGRAIVCEKTASTRSQTEKNLRFGQRWQISRQAQQKLAEYLSVKREEVRIVGAHDTEMEKVGPSCKKGPTGKKIRVIELRFQKRIYQYAVIGDRLVLCK